MYISDSVPSQVPQPTCYWKWVGVSIPQKVGNFSLRPSSTAIWPRSRLSGCLLSSYGSWLPQTPTLNFHISPSAAVAGHLCHPPNPHFAPSQSSFRYCCVYVMIFLLKRRLCIKIDFYDNSQVLDFYDYESHKIIQINHFLIFTWSKKLLLDFYS